MSAMALTAAFWQIFWQVDTPVAIEKAAITASAAAIKDEDKVMENIGYQTAGEAAVPATAASTPIAGPKHSMEGIGKLIQDLAHSDNTKVYAALDALNMDLKEDKNKCYKIQIAGGCHALVLLLKKCTESPVVCAQVTALNELAELTTLHKTLHIMIRLTHHLDESKVGIAANGGVEAVVKAMKTFPKCQKTQLYSCFLLHNLACCRIGKKRIVESDGMKYTLAVINNHLDHADTCERACSILMVVIADSNDNTEVFIDLGGAAAVVKVNNMWPENYRIQSGISHLSGSIAAYFNR
jgi:hypothetical protein